MQTTVTIPVTLPEELLRASRLSKSEAPVRLKQSLALDLLRQRRLAFGKAAELLDMSQAEFLSLCAEHRISVFEFTEDELEEELSPL
jgi:predicted HTH domain antitoxin